VTVSLMADDVEMSLRDLVTLSLTISDNPATDALIGAVGVDAVNGLLSDLGCKDTWLRSDLNTMLEAMAVEVGYADFSALMAVDQRPGDPTPDDLRQRLAASAALDPTRGSRTSARDSVRLLQAIWNDAAGPADACAAVRRGMLRQLTRHRIASGFPPEVTVAAKSGGLMGIVRNEIGVVTFPDDRRIRRGGLHPHRPFRPCRCASRRRRDRDGGGRGRQPSPRLTRRPGRATAVVVSRLCAPGPPRTCRSFP
jgi:beta-lactamase class A